MKKTILHAIDVCGSGGAETVFIQLISYLDRNKYKSIVILPGKGWLYEQLIKINVSPILINMSGSFNLMYLYSLFKIAKKNKVDIIHSHLFGSNIYCSIIGMFYQCKVISTFHGGIDIALNERYLSFKSFLLNLGSAKIVSVSNHLMKQLNARLNLCKKKHIVIYNGINFKDYNLSGNDDYRKKYNIKENEIFVALVGNDNFVKAYDVVSEAANMLNDTPYKFIIAGEHKRNINHLPDKEQANSKCKNNLVYAGFIDDIAHFLISADIYLLSSRDEGFSISTIEAMASKTPVIATKCGGPEEIIENEVTGLLIEANNPGSIVQALLKLENNQQLKDKLVFSAYRHVKDNFTIEKTIQSYSNLYQELAK